MCQHQFPDSSCSLLKPLALLMQLDVSHFFFFLYWRQVAALCKSNARREIYITATRWQRLRGKDADSGLSPSRVNAPTERWSINVRSICWWDSLPQIMDWGFCRLCGLENHLPKIFLHWCFMMTALPFYFSKTGAQYSVFVDIVQN